MNENTYEEMKPSHSSAAAKVVARTKLENESRCVVPRIVALDDSLPVGTELFIKPPAPDGWMLMPINATAAMLEVLKSARIHEWSTTRAIYAGLLAAAPEPPR